MSFTAADLQKKHALEGAPDPFPSLSENTKPSQSKEKAAKATFDTGSEDLFPSLAPSAHPAPKQAAAPTAWVRPPKASIVKAPQFTESFDLGGDIDLRTADKDGKRTALGEALKNKDGKTTTLGEVMKVVAVKTGAHVQGSTQRNRSITTFVIQTDSEAAVDKARRMLTSLLSPTVTVKVDAPVSTVGGIIGAKGATLKQIRDQTDVRIDIPRRDTNPEGHLSAPNGSNSGTRTPSPLPQEDEDEAEEPTVAISVTGSAPSVKEAVEMIRAIIGVRTSKITRRIKGVPAHIFPFVMARSSQLESDAMEQFSSSIVTVNSFEKGKEHELAVAGDREAVVLVVEGLNAAISELLGSVKSVSISVPRKQHRLITGYAGEEILSEYKVVVRPDEDADTVTIWGQQPDLYPALGPILEKSNSETIVTHKLPGPLDVAKQIQTYLERTSFLDTLVEEHPSLTIEMSPESTNDKTNTITVDFIGKEAPEVKAAVKKLEAMIKKLKDGMKTVSVDWLLHKLLIGKSGKKVNSFQEAHNVLVYYPHEGSEISSVLLVHDPLSTAGSASAAEKKKHLAEVEKELMKLVADAADITEKTIKVDKKWHGTIVGKHGSTLNDIVGEEQLLSIKVGSSAKLASNQTPLADDEIFIRGPKAEVDRAAAEIHRIAAEAEDEAIHGGYVAEFEINRDYVGRIVGSQGAGVNKLRDQLNVKVDFSDDAGDDKEWAEKGKKRKTTGKSKVTIVGRKEKVEEAKKRILAQIERLADETAETIKIPRAYHSGLIGPGGKYVTRLQDKYDVKITFPRDSDDYGDSSRTREPLKTDEVFIKGGKKGVAGAKAELIETYEYEKTNNVEEKFAVPTRAVARILGKGGVSINEIKDETGAQIDIDKEEYSVDTTTITVRGTSKACKEAKAKIMAISEGVDDETTVTLEIESKYHRNFIGKGGETLKEIIQRVGGPSDPKLQAGLVHFPRHGEAPDEVHLRGDKKLVKKLQAELEKMAAGFRDRVVLAIGIPAAQHGSLIGRGGQHLNELQTKTGAQIWFPGSRTYGNVGEPENVVSDVAPEDLVKVVGPRAACEKALEELRKPPPQSQSQIRGGNRGAPAGSLSMEVKVPLKYHGAITHQGNVLRNIRSIGVFVEQSKVPETSHAPTRPPPKSSGDASAARIDADGDGDEPSSPDIEWQVIPNYEGAEEGESVWTLKGADQAALDSAATALATAIDHATQASHVGFLTLADRSVFPRIVGTKGANVQRLRNETGADITVGRDDNTIIIVGSEDAIEAAKEAILQTASSGSRFRK